MSGRKDELKRKRAEAVAEANGIIAEAKDAGRELTSDERTKVKSKVDEAKSIDQEVGNIEADESLVDDLGELAGPPEEGDPEADPKAGKVTAKKDRRSLGERVTEDEAFKAYLASIVVKGQVPDSQHVDSPAVNLGGFKDIITGSEDDRGGALVDDDFRGLLDGLGALAQPLTVRQLFTPGTTESDLVTFVRMLSLDNQAAPTPEATGTSAGTGSDDVAGTKPESDFTLERVSTAVVTVPHMVTATKRALADAGQLRTLIDQFLRFGLEEEFEDQLINGDGLGDNFTGVLETSGIQSQPFDTDLLATARKAKTNVRVNGKTAATAYLLNPEDNETIDLLKDDEGRYYFGGPAAVGTDRLWGLPRIESEAVPAGTGIVANWRFGTIWDRMATTITMSDSHEDYFRRNLVAILAEFRAAFGIVRPSAFCTFSTSAGS